MISKILIVDDEPDIVRMLYLKLQRSGFEVFTAYNGAEAVAKTIQFQPVIF